MKNAESYEQACYLFKATGIPINELMFGVGGQ